MRRKTVVLVCMVDSIHVARWIAQFEPTEVKFILFPSGPNRRVHPKIVEMISRGRKIDEQITIVPFGGKLSLLLWVLDRFTSDQIRGFILRRLVARVNPDFVHALEFQHAGYIVNRALTPRFSKPKLIVTNYGSDIYWFQRFPKHLKRIRELLSKADLYSAECERDVALAYKHGFHGTVLPVMPNAGGFDLDLLNRELIQPSKRTTIAIKGYENWAGKSTIALEGLRLASDLLAGYKVVLYSAETRAVKLAKRISKEVGIPITIFRKNKLTHNQLMSLFSDSRLYIGVSRTDGISTSLLEAMAMGAYPIQTDTSCAAEWIDDASGRLLKGLDPDSVADAIRFALTKDSVVDSAAEINRAIIRDRASSSRAVIMSRQFYTKE